MIVRVDSFRHRFYSGLRLNGTRSACIH